MTITDSQLLEKLRCAGDFDAVLNIINIYFDFTPVPWSNNGLKQGPDESQGSQKVLAIAQYLGMVDTDLVLSWFKEHYKDELKNKGNHPNIRKIIEGNIDDVVFYGKLPLKLKKEI